MVIEHIVLIQCRSIEVDIAAYKVSLAGIQQGLDHVDILVNAVGGRLHHIGPLDVQLTAVCLKGFGIIVSNVHNGLVLTLGTLDHLILAGVGVGSQMAHVSDVHDTLNVIANITQGLFQHILHDVGPQIADVSIVIHGRAAGVHLHQLGIVGNKQFLLVTCRVIQIHIEFLQMLFYKNKTPLIPKGIRGG